jgi:hypothetical protein
MKTFGILTLAAILGSGALGCSASTESESPSDGEQSETTETVSSALQIGTTHDQCSSSNQFYVLDGQTNQWVSVPQDGAWHTVNVGHPRFKWLCGLDPWWYEAWGEPAGWADWTTCNSGTTYVKVRHLTDSRQIDWSCQR